MRQLLIGGVLAAGLPAQPPQGPSPPLAGCQIVVLGTAHAPAMFAGEAYTPAHIRAALEAIAPDVVAVECHPSWFEVGRFHMSTYEAQGVAVPFARERGLPVYGVDWKDIADWDRTEERNALAAASWLRPALKSGEPLPMTHFGFRAPDAPAGKQAPAMDWLHLNSEEYGRQQYRGKSPEDADFGPRRDREIAAHCARVLAAHPGKRLALVIGAFHKPYQEIFAQRLPGVRVLRMGRDIPWPEAESVRAAWRPRDLLVTLGHRIDGFDYHEPQRIDRQSALDLLGRLRRAKTHARQVRYFEARLAMLTGDEAAACAALDGLIEEDVEAVLYPYPMGAWRQRYALTEAARIERARLALRAGDRKLAERLLERVRAGLEFRVHMLEQTRPRELRRDDALADWNFESGDRGQWPHLGWFTYLPTGQGALRFSGDEETRTEGSRSLRVEVTQAPRHRFHLQQVASFPAGVDLGGLDHFEFDVRGRGVEELIVHLDPPYTGVTGALGKAVVDLREGEWVRARVPLPLSETREIEIALSFRAEPGAVLWLDNGTRLRFEYMTVPREWSKLVLAREFPRSLLAFGAGLPK